MDDQEIETLAEDARVHGEALVAAERDRDIMAEADAAYKEMYGGGPEHIGSGDTHASGTRRRWSSLIRNAIDWSM